jgi:MFS family permease
MFTPNYKRYVLVAMTTIYTVNLLDRGLMTILLQPIKEDLHLTDTQLGLVTGVVFGLFYAILGLPIARWADRGNRVSITSLAIGLWSLTVMGCVFVSSYLQLVLARICAGIGESGCRAPIYSLLGDYFPGPAERTRAMYLWDMSGPLAGLVSFVAAGWLNEAYGWRLTFFLVGLPGVLLALLFKWTVVEPRARAGRTEHHAQKPTQLKSVLLILWTQRSCRRLTVAMVLIFTMAQGLAPWYAAFMIRSHGMGTAELGVWLGLAWGASGLLGLLLGAYMVGRWFSGDERRLLRMSALTAALNFPCFAAFLLLPHRYLALSALLPQSVLLYLFMSPVAVFLQRLVPDDMRATMFAVVMLLANLIGMGIGPQLVGVLSDLLTPAYGPHALRYAMLVVSLLIVAAGYYLWAASRTIQEDLAAMARGQAAEAERARSYSVVSEPASSFE